MVPEYAEQSVLLATQPAPLVTHPDKKIEHYASVFTVFGACPQFLSMQALIAPDVVRDQQGTPAVVIAEHVDYKPKYVPHPPLVHPIFPFQKHEDK